MSSSGTAPDMTPQINDLWTTYKNQRVATEVAYQQGRSAAQAHASRGGHAPGSEGEAAMLAKVDRERDKVIDTTRSSLLSPIQSYYMRAAGKYFSLGQVEKLMTTIFDSKIVEVSNPNYDPDFERPDSKTIQGINTFNPGQSYSPDSRELRTKVQQQAWKPRIGVQEMESVDDYITRTIAERPDMLKKKDTSKYVTGAVQQQVQQSRAGAGRLMQMYKDEDNLF